MFVIKYGKKTMTFALYSAWIKLGRWKEVNELYGKAYEDGRITASQCIVLQKRCFREHLKEYAQMTQRIMPKKVGA